MFPLSLLVPAVKKQRLAVNFTPEAIQDQLHQGTQVHEELKSAFVSLFAIEILSVFRRKLVIDKQQVLLLVSCKLTFHSVFLLKMALDHILLSFSVNNNEVTGLHDSHPRVIAS